MLVMEKEYFESPMALELYDLLEEDAPALPQSEPSLRISRVPTPSFQGSLQLVRNVLLLDVDPQRYSKVSLKYSYDDWAKGHVVARMTSPSPDSVRTYLKTQGEGLMNLFVRHELFLYGEVIGKTYSQKATDLTDSLFAHRINVPEDIRSQRIGKDFLWMSNSSMRSRHQLRCPGRQARLRTQGQYIWRVRRLLPLHRAELWSALSPRTAPQRRDGTRRAPRSVEDGGRCDDGRPLC